jgi:hypothetical protein
MSANPETVQTLAPRTCPQIKPPRRVESPAERARRAARDRARKGLAAPSPEQAQALALASIIRAHAANFPALSPEIEQFLYVLGQRGSETKDRVLDSVLHMLRAGPASLEDFIEELKFSELVLLSALESLHTWGVVREVPRGRSSVWELTGKPLPVLPAGALL